MEEDSIKKSMTKVVFYIILTIIALAVVKWVFNDGVKIMANLTNYNGIYALKDYEIYANLLVIIVFGWMIINSVASTFYLIFNRKYGESAAAAIRSLVRILGIGGLIAGIAGSVGGGAASVALGGFIGMVIGFATQQVLGQAIAGLFIMITRPFKINDVVDVAGESEVVVKDITSLFTVVERKDGLIVLVPSSMIIGQKIVIRNKSGK
jgi:small-conductance mechanosensitive channel